MTKKVAKKEEENFVKKITELEAYKLEVFHLESDKYTKEIEIEKLKVENAQLRIALNQVEIKQIGLEIGQRKQHQQTLLGKAKSVSSEKEVLVAEIKKRLGISQDKPLDINSETLEVLIDDHKEV